MLTILMFLYPNFKSNILLINVFVSKCTGRSANNELFVFYVTALPQPTAEYPAVLFEGENYNNCSSNGTYKRLRANDFVKWGENLSGKIRARKFTWRSMLILPGVNITFRACCPSGNDFITTVSGWSSTADLHLSVLYHPELQGNDGVWYQRKIFGYIAGLEIRQNKICGGECDSCKF